VQKAFAPKKNKWAKFVIIKKAFTLDQVNDPEDEGAILEIKEDMRSAAEKFGEVTKVVLYDKEPEGVLSVRFKEFEEAEAFVKAFNGKGYNCDKLQLSVADDRPKFQKSGRDDISDVEDNVRRMEAYMDGDRTDEDDE
jgi:HIV Tat-specific factor 1